MEQETDKKKAGIGQPMGTFEIRDVPSSATFAVCPVCLGGPLDGHVAGCSALAQELPLEAKDGLSEVSSKLRAWLKHSRDSGSLHVAIPCDAVDRILSLLMARELEQTGTESAPLLPVLRQIAEELKNIRLELSIANGLRSGE